jgi:hypothetical protein
MKKGTLMLASALAAGAALFAGCAMDSHGHVYRDWSKRMAEMGIFPVYPPREDIVVGDVYALPLHPYDTAAVGYIGGLGNAGIHVDYLGDTNLLWTNFLAKLGVYYSTRPYPADSTNAAATNMPLTSIIGYEDATQRKSAFTPGSVARLRQVSFPDFNISHVGQGSLSAVVPIEGIMAGFNFNHSDITDVHFSIPHAESYGMTVEELLKELQLDHHFLARNGNLYLRADSKEAVISVGGAQLAYAMFQDIFENLRRNSSSIPWTVRWHMRKSAKNMKDKIYLALISEVYFARSMDITIDRKSATGASGSARPIAASELKQLKDMGLLATHSQTTNIPTTNQTTTATSTNIVTGTKAELIDVSAGDTAYDLAKKLRGLDTPDSIDKIGGSVKIVSVSASSIGLRRTFQRPIVVGVRGVMVKIDVNHPEEFVVRGKTNQWFRIDGIGSADEKPGKKIDDRRASR